MTPTDPGFSSIITGSAALIGALLGGASAVIAQLVTQGSISRREALERTRGEARVYALFASRVDAIEELLGYQANDGSVFDLGTIDRHVEPLEDLITKTDLMLMLEPRIIRALSSASMSLSTTQRFVLGYRAHFNNGDEPNSSRGFDSIEREREFLMKTYSVPHKKYLIVKELLASVKFS